MPREVFGKKDLFSPVAEGNVKTPKRQSVKATKPQNVKASKRLDIKTLKPQDIKTPRLLRKTIYFTEELWEGIRKEAYEKKKDYSEVVREVVKGVLESQTENE